MGKVNLTLSEKIDDLVKQDGRKASVIADKIGISQSMLSKYQNGKTPTVDTLKKIAQYFHVSVDSLLGLNDSLPDETIKISARKYTGLEYSALQNLHDCLLNRPFTKEQKHVASWFIASTWFFKLIDAIDDYRIETEEYMRLINEVREKEKRFECIVVDDGTKAQSDLKRRSAKLDMVDIMLKIAQEIEDYGGNIDGKH